MPPEPSPVERKDLARKYDRCPPSDTPTGGSAGGPFTGPRWRDPHRGPREFYSPSPRRPPSGHHKQVYAEEALPPSEDEGFRCYSGRYGSSSGRDGGGGGGREGGRGYLRRSPWSGGAHQENGGGAQRSAPDLPKPAPSSSSSSSPVVATRDHARVWVGDAVDDGPGTTGHRHERERDRDRDHSLGSISWKPLKWPRSGSFSSPGGAKANGSGSDTEEGRHAEASPAVVAALGKESSPLRPQADSQQQKPAAADEGNPRKRQRLGWGQGLAKYEKEKVEGSEANATKIAAAILMEASSNPEAAPTAGSDSPASKLRECSSLPQVEEDKLHAAAEATESKNHAPVLSDFMTEKYPLDSAVDIDNLDVSTLSHVGSFVGHLLQTEDTSSGDLNTARQIALDRLLLLKGEISKLVEKAEAVIDSCEMELKNLNDRDEEIGSAHSLTKLHDVPNNVPHCTDSSFSNKNDTISIIAASPGASLHENPMQSYLLVHDCNHGSPDMAKSRSDAFQSTVEGISGSGAKLLEAQGNCAVDKVEEVAATQLLTSTVGCKVESASSLIVGGVHSDAISDQCLSGEVDLLLNTKIFDSNKEHARKASEVFAECSASRISPFDADLDNVPNLRIKEKLMVCKRSLRFKEQVLTLKFKAFHHLWREDLRLLDLLAVKKNASKPPKGSEVRCHSSQNGQQKPRSLTRSRLPVPAGNVTLSPTAEILDMTSKLISKSEIQMHRKNLKMPSMILDERERRHSIFVTSNGLVEDPHMVEKEKALINPWTEAEQEAFKEKLVMFGKDFRKIASFLDNKTTADCIEFYYKNHRSESFEAVRKILASRKQSQSLPSTHYMVASGRKWKDETNAASLDVLGAASVFVSHSNDVAGVRHKFYSRTSVGGSNVLKISRGSHAKIAVDSYAETTAADVLAGIGSAMSSEGMSSCVTSSVDPAEKLESMPVDRPLFSEVSQSICEEDAFSDEGRGELDSVDWSDDEKSVFIRALRLYGKDFARISVCLGTRSKEQCKVFYSKARKCLGLDMVYQGPAVNGETPLSDANGGRSDTDEACAVEVDSTLCTTQSCSKVDVNWSLMKVDCEEASHLGNSPCEDVKLAEGQIAGETTVQAFEKNCENQPFVFSQMDIQSSETELGQTKVTPEALADSPPRNRSLESRVDQQLSDDEMNGQGTEMPVVMHQCNSKDVIQQQGSGSPSADASKPEPQQLKVSTVSFDRKLPRESCIDANAMDGMDDSKCHPGKYGNYFLDTIFGNGITSQQGSNLPPLPHKKSQAVSWKQKENSPSAKPLLADPKPLVFSGHDPVISLPSNFNFDSDNKNVHPMEGGDHPSYAVSNQSLIGFDQSPHALRGYPLHLLNMRNDELGDLLHRSVSTGNISKKNGSIHASQMFLPDMHADKGNMVGTMDPEPACTYTCNNDEPAEGLLRPCSGDTSVEAEMPSARTGDVKLFGQILSHQSLQKPNDTEVKPPSTKENRILNFRLPNGRADGISDPSNAETSSYLGLAEEWQQRSNDWWDGQKAQAGFSSLANSALCLPKCPSVVSGVAYHPKKFKPVSSRGVVVHQRLFPAEGKGQIIFPELQNRVRIDAVPGFQQPARVAMNLVSGGDSLGCAVVSDPVAALRLHFAKQIATSLGSNEEPHRGDLGNSFEYHLVQSLVILPKILHQFGTGPEVPG